MTELLDAVDALTKPFKEQITQDVYMTRTQPDGRPVIDEHGNPVRDVKGSQKVTITQEPLLEQLEAAIASTIGGGAGRSERRAVNVLDSDALYKFTQIVAQITDWCRMVKVRASRRPSTDLRRWYAARLATNPDSDDWYVASLHSWARTIRAKLNPWAKWEVDDACPKCHATTWVEETKDLLERPITVTRNRPLLVEYPLDRDIFQYARATCRACGNEWVGRTALRELRWDIDHPDTPNPISHVGVDGQSVV